MNFTRKPVQPFAIAGIDLGTPIDKLAPGKWSMLKNLRCYSDGQLTTRPGLADDSGAAQAIYTFPGAGYLHSILRVNDSSPESSFGWARFVGTDDGKLYVGQTGTEFALGWNPVATGFSGNPLSLIPCRPVGGGSSVVYVGDSAKMAEIVFRPQDDFTGGPQIYSIGTPPPNGFGAVGGPLPTSSGVIATPASGGAGNLTGTYWWRFVFRNIYTGKRSNPSCPTRANITPDPVYGSVGLSTGLALSAERATMVLPDRVAGDQGIDTVSGDNVVDVYRFGGTVFDWHYVGSGNQTETFTDDLSDLDILSSPTPPVDALGNFALNQPFPTTDISRDGTLQFVAPGGAGTGTPIYIKASSFNPPTPDQLAIWNSYLPGTQVIVDNNYRVTFFRFGTDSVDLVVEITEDIPAGLTPGTDYSYRILSPIRVGVPLAHLWGPMGAGNAGLVVFGCGDPRQAGTLYWTNPNDPDSCALTNSLEVTGPSEALVNGLVWSDGRNYLWSSLRAFEVVPDLSVPGSFLARQIAHMGGLLAPWGLCDCGDFIAYAGYDGIYATQGVGSQSLTDADLYPWFPHDASPGFASTRGGDLIQPPDQEHLDKWRLAWQDGVLYFDWPPVAS